ncbi:hypothetical protein [Raineyella fluvialis]|uniref:hypothetical protein n=1 Tax=Raineyella fluvialis TaxID=2662261 RepID=UPI001E435886|nr:hypothetical protein [Raineyella fluvialis]
MTDEPLDPARVRGALDSPSLKLLSAHTAWWVVPLFSEHLEPAQGPVSAAWFHRRVAEALQAFGLPESPTPPSTAANGSTRTTGWSAAVTPRTAG